MRVQSVARSQRSESRERVETIKHEPRWTGLKTLIDWHWQATHAGLSDRTYLMRISSPLSILSIAKMPIRNSPRSAFIRSAGVDWCGSSTGGTVRLDVRIEWKNPFGRDFGGG